jgi:HK97 family phage major capsid protein
VKTYEQIVNEIADLEASQREITQLAEPTDQDTKNLWKIEGKRDLLLVEKDAAHKREVEAALSAPVVAGETIAKLGLREMKTNDEMDIQFFRSMGFRNAGNAFQSGKIREARASLASNTGSGSYLVPQEWHATVEEYRFQRNFLREAGAMVVTTESTHNIPVLTALSSPTIVGENTAYTASDPTIGQVILYAYKLTDKIPVSEELLADAAYDVEGVLARAIGLGFGAAEETYFLTGTGSSQPTGIFNKAADKTLASASAITNDELIETVYALARHYRNGASWMMDDATVALIAKNKLTVTTSGTLPYFWQDSVGGELPRLLGYPVYTNSNIANIAASAKVICFGNAQYYVIGERGPLNVKRLQLTEYGDTFAYHQRIDGKPLDPAAFQVVAMAAS